MQTELTHGHGNRRRQHQVRLYINTAHLDACCLTPMKYGATEEHRVKSVVACVPSTGDKRAPKQHCGGERKAVKEEPDGRDKQDGARSKKYFSNLKKIKK